MSKSKRLPELYRKQDWWLNKDKEFHRICERFSALLSPTPLELGGVFPRNNPEWRAFWICSLYGEVRPEGEASPKYDPRVARDLKEALFKKGLRPLRLEGTKAEALEHVYREVVKNDHYPPSRFAYYYLSIKAHLWLYTETRSEKLKRAQLVVRYHEDIRSRLEARKERIREDPKLYGRHELIARMRTDGWILQWENLVQYCREILRHHGDPPAEVAATILKIEFAVAEDELLKRYGLPLDEGEARLLVRLILNAQKKKVQDLPTERILELGQRVFRAHPGAFRSPWTLAGEVAYKLEPNNPNKRELLRWNLKEVFQDYWHKIDLSAPDPFQTAVVVDPSSPLQKA